MPRRARLVPPLLQLLAQLIVHVQRFSHRYQILAVGAEDLVKPIQAPLVNLARREPTEDVLQPRGVLFEDAQPFIQRYLTSSPLLQTPIVRPSIPNHPKKPMSRGLTVSDKPIAPALPLDYRALVARAPRGEYSVFQLLPQPHDKLHEILLRLEESPGTIELQSIDALETIEKL